MFFDSIERDSKGACKKSVQWTVFPRHRSARRRANPYSAAGDGRSKLLPYSFTFTFPQGCDTINIGKAVKM